MPEGHTIHRLAEDLESDLQGGPVSAFSPQGRFTDGASLIDGSLLLRSEAWGKHLFCWWDNGSILHIHLGLIGKFRKFTIEQEPSETVRLRLESDSTAWQLTGPQTCSVINEEDWEYQVSKLGPDPLRLGKRGKKQFSEKILNTSLPLGAALLKQELIAGIGNVYRSEILFINGIHPEISGKDLTKTEANEIWDTAVVLLRKGKNWNKIITVTPDDHGGRVTKKTHRRNALYAYKRSGFPCRRCATPIVQSTLAARSIWFCPSCQKGPDA